MTDLPAESAPPGAPTSPRPDPDRAWWGDPDPVEVFAAGLELSLRQLRVEIAGLRAERDGLRLEVEGLRAKLVIAQEQLVQRESLSDTVRQLQAAIGRLTLGAAAQPEQARPAGAPAVSDVPVTLPRPERDPFAPPEPDPVAPPLDVSAPSEPSALDQLAALGVWPPRAARAHTVHETDDDAFAAPRLDAVRADEPPAESDPTAQPEPRGIGPTATPPPSMSRSRRVLTAAVVALGVVLITSVLLVSVGPRVFPYQTYFLRSGSMEPTISSGALIVLTKSDSASLVPGDIITFNNPLDRDVLVTHRIVDVETNVQGRMFITKGDANARPDPWRVPATGTGWKYALDVPVVGYVFAFLAASQVRIALIVLPALILGVLALLDRWRPPDDL